jgi:hypothetical protein
MISGDWVYVLYDKSMGVVAVIESEHLAKQWAEAGGNYESFQLDFLGRAFRANLGSEG